jgi:hypothetical protein
MHVSLLDDHTSPLAAADAPPFRHKECRITHIARSKGLLPTTGQER